MHADESDAYVHDFHVLSREPRGNRCTAIAGVIRMGLPSDLLAIEDSALDQFGDEAARVSLCGSPKPLAIKRRAEPPQDRVLATGRQDHPESLVANWAT